MFIFFWIKIPRLQNFIEQFTGRLYKWFAFNIFLRLWGFTKMSSNFIFGFTPLITTFVTAFASGSSFIL